MKEDLVAIPFSGRSMDPVFKNVHLVWADFSQKQTPQVGDVILYRDQSKEWVCHRLIFYENNGVYWLKGDANTTAEFMGEGFSWATVRAVQRGKRCIPIGKTFLTNFICLLQRKQILVRSNLLKKIYRLSIKLLLIVEAFFST
jgi:hypothetical protein